MELGLACAPLLVAYAVATVAAYWVALLVYRLVLHPLAKFPGPRLAAATTWYEAYYDIVQGGQYSKKISELHDLYGPVLRVTPDEIHIRDSRFFDTVYPSGVHLDKVGWDKRFGTENGLLMTVHGAAHKRRRAALAPMFSRRSILDFIHIIHGHVDTFAVRLQEFEVRKEPMNLTNVFPALTGDVIMDYFFGFNQGQIKSPDFTSFHAAFMNMGSTGHWATQFHFILPMMDMIPDWIVAKLQPAAKPLLDLRSQNRSLVQQTLLGTDLKRNDAKTTVFHELLHSKHLVPAEKSQSRLEDEAMTIVAGGVETTAYALNVASYHIIANPHIYARLHADLVAALPDGASQDLLTLEQIPYLRACIMEAVRLTYGLSARNPRTHDKDIRYKQWLIPKRTCVSMSVPDVNHDEDIFPHSHLFVPERWLDGAGVGLEKYMVSFGRGTRSCIGVNLAWAELYIVLGTMFRGWKFELFETGVRDVEMGADYFIPHVWRGSGGVRVLVGASGD
ncbi:cytochrome P450 [Massarina eburnea CBS 473.64]|uniref:Cytochrome P450 n=1 Tax=Massarina eburnea CBS 473.64 TaxID=1395130 RepID=A0A6A6RH14_9PLEO|nr:cytochrome P450 [Massarina eburnea CBS 473.64]